MQLINFKYVEIIKLIYFDVAPSSEYLYECNIKQKTNRLYSAARLRLYHCLENSRLYQEVPEQYLVLDDDEQADVVSVLIQAYPEYTAIQALPGEELENKVCRKLSLTSLIYVYVNCAVRIFAY